MDIEEQVASIYGLKSIELTELNTLANYAIRVASSQGQYALKLYNPASRNAAEVQWEIELTNHLIESGVPVAKPIKGESKYVQSFDVDGEKRVAILFEWAPGEKPKPELNTFILLGRCAALIHDAADSFTSQLTREKYDLEYLIDHQLELLDKPLHESGQYQRVQDLTQRLRDKIANLNLDWGVCHIDLTLDNVHRDGDDMTVFDLDSAAFGWRAYEAWGTKKAGEEKFQAWLEGYRSVRSFSQDDERAVAVFSILGDIANVTWKLGLAKSSRGKPLMLTQDLPKIVDEWLEWENEKVNQ